jgi:heme/copper-type cytochrome/quinol oxidase subunit 2
MSESNSSITLSAFLLGALPRQLLTAMILEGVGLLGYFQFTTAGLVDIHVTSTYLLEVAIIGLVAVVLTPVFVHRIGTSSYSPVLHVNRNLFFVAVGYTALGITITAVTFVTHSLIQTQSPIPTLEEIGFGVSIGAIFGFLVLLYISRFGVETIGL